MVNFTELPSVSIILPIRNEENNIKTCQTKALSSTARIVNRQKREHTKQTQHIK